MTPTRETTRQPYQTPQVESLSAQEIQTSLGPAIAVYGGLPGNDLTNG